MTKEAFDHILANKEVTSLILKLGHEYCLSNICDTCPLNLNPKFEVKGFRSGCALSLFSLSMLSDKDAEKAISFVNGIFN